MGVVVEKGEGGCRFCLQGRRFWVVAVSCRGGVSVLWQWCDGRGNKRKRERDEVVFGVLAVVG